MSVLWLGRKCPFRVKGILSSVEACSWPCFLSSQRDSPGQGPALPVAVCSPLPGLCADPCQLLSSLFGLDWELSLALLPSQPSGLAAWGSDWQAQMTAPTLLVLFEAGNGRKLSIEQLR